MGTNYYVEFRPCEHCGLRKKSIHIGKSSAGWKFHFRGYRQLGGLDDVYTNHPDDKVILSWKGWQQYLSQLEAENESDIKDEYGEVKTLRELESFIEAKQASGDLDGEWLRHMQKDYDWVDTDGYQFTDREFC